MFLGQLAGDDRIALAERCMCGGQERREPAARLEEHDRPRLGGERREACAARPRAARQKPLEDEPLRREPGDGDERGHRRGPRHRHDRHARGQCASHEVISRIRDPRRPRVRHERDACAPAFSFSTIPGARARSTAS